MISIYFNLKTSFQVFQNYLSLPKIRTNQPIFVMAQQLEKDAFVQLIRQTLSRDDYKEKLTSLLLSALIENENINVMTCEKRGIYTKDECTQTDVTHEEGQNIPESFTELRHNMEPNNEHIVPRTENQRGSFARTWIPHNMQNYSFDPYCSRFLLEMEETSRIEQRERSSSRSTATSRSSSGSRRSSRSRSMRSRSRTSSRSPRRRRRASPSFMESRRITSARKMPVPYTRTRPERENY